MRKKGGDIHRRYILITYCDGIAWKKGYPHTLLTSAALLGGPQTCAAPG